MSLTTPDSGLGPQSYVDHSIPFVDSAVTSETLASQPGILIASVTDLETLPLPAPLFLQPGCSVVVPVAPHPHFDRFGDSTRLSGRSGITQAGGEIQLTLTNEGPLARLTNHGHLPIGTAEGSPIAIGAALSHSTQPTQGDELLRLAEAIRLLEHQSRAPRVVTSGEYGLPFDGLELPIEYVYKSIHEARTDTIDAATKCLDIGLIPSGPDRQKLYEVIGLDPTPHAVHRPNSHSPIKPKESGLVLSATQQLVLPRDTALMIQTGIWRGNGNQTRIYHLNSPLLKPISARGDSYTHRLKFETLGTPDSIIVYAYRDFAYL